jgi:hypothetical protein
MNHVRTLERWEIVEERIDSPTMITDLPFSMFDTAMTARGKEDTGESKNQWNTVMLVWNVGIQGI